MRGMQSTTDSLDFVTIEGLLAYGRQFARQPVIDGVSAPAAPVSSNDPANDRVAVTDTPDHNGICEAVL